MNHQIIASNFYITVKNEIKIKIKLKYILNIIYISYI